MRTKKKCHFVMNYKEKTRFEKINYVMQLENYDITIEN